jgi:dihydroorotase
VAELVVRGGTVVDAGGSRRADVLVADGVIRAVEADLDVPSGAPVLDADGCLVAPGLVDLHTHLRQPGREEAETVETGARAAALGGYTAIVAMPNTEPTIDSAGVAREVLELGRTAAAEVAVAGAITVGRAGERLAPMAELAALGVRLFTDDGAGVQDGGLMRRALDYAAGLRAQGTPVVLAQHCEDERLAGGGSMHEGAWSSRLGIPGIPAAAEEAMVARDIALVRLTGCPVHFLHLSTAGSVELVRAARAEGLAVTAEAAPHHFALTDGLVAGYDPVFKVNPPLRTDDDVAAIKAGLVDGTIDAIATDHAPHAPEMKDRPFDQAPPGMLGLETALAVALTELPLPPERVLALLSWQPAAIAGLAAGSPGGPAGQTAHGGPVVPGADANLCVVDPVATWTVDAGRLASRSRNTPYAGRKLTGRVRHTVLRGEPVVVDAEAQR